MTVRGAIFGAALCASGAGIVLGGMAGDGATRAALRTADAPGSYTVSLSPVGDVRFARPPRRAVTLDAQYEDMLVALDHEAALVATGFQGNDYDAFYAQIPGLRVELDRATLPAIGVGLDKEVLYALAAEVHHVDPERLIRTPGWSRPDVAEIAHNVGPFFANRYSREQTYPGAAPYTYYSAWALAAKVGEVYRRSDRIAALEAIGAALNAAIEARLPPPEARPRVGLVMYANGRFTPFSLARPGFGTAHYRAVGARDAFAGIQDQTFADAGRGGEMDLEGLLAIDPDVLIMPFAIYARYRARFAELEALADDPLAGRLRALRDGRVYPGGTPLQGPLFLLFQTEMVAKQLYPERFGPFREDAAYPPEAQLFDRAQVARALALDP